SGRVGGGIFWYGRRLRFFGGCSLGRRWRTLGFSPGTRLEHRNGRHHLRNSRRFWSSGDGDATSAAPLQHLYNHVPLLRVEAAQLVFHVEAGLPAKLKQVFPFDV